jgi:hypothetical protein
MSLASCTRCDGLIPRGRATCPHCDRPVRRWVARAACAGTALMTLMACYGMAARPYDYNRQPDVDGDGVADDADCDDGRNTTYPGAADVEGDGIDSDCDGVDGWADPSAPTPTPTPVATEPATDAGLAPKAIAVDPSTPSP